MYVITFYALFIVLLGLFIPADINTASITKQGVQALATNKSSDDSTFEYFDVQAGELAQQMILKSREPFSCKKYTDNEKHQFILEVTGLKLNSLDHKTIQQKIALLLSKGYIRSLDVVTSGNTATFTLNFSPTRQIVNTETNEQEQVKNSILIRSCAYEKQFTIDIYTQNALDDILNKTSETVKYAALDKKKYSGPLLAMNKTMGLVPLRIMVDAGHGGNDLGAKSYNGLTEKDVALDISKRVHRILKDKKYQTYMTRYTDVEMPLAQRALLATQMQADVFVSIHANGAVNQKARGIETYFFPAKELRERNNIDFVFINQPKDLTLVQTIQDHISIMANGSHQLAASILNRLQTGVVSHHHETMNRGLKPENFRLFLQNSTMQIPSALVEVGFLTNRQEADLLARTSYRKKIAQHIADGISSFIDSCTNISAL